MTQFTVQFAETGEYCDVDDCGHITRLFYIPKGYDRQWAIRACDSEHAQTRLDEVVAQDLLHPLPPDLDQAQAIEAALARCTCRQTKHAYLDEAGILRATWCLHCYPLRAALTEARDQTNDDE